MITLGSERVCETGSAPSRQTYRSSEQLNVQHDCPTGSLCHFTLIPGDRLPDVLLWIFSLQIVGQRVHQWVLQRKREAKNHLLRVSRQCRGKVSYRQRLEYPVCVLILSLSRLSQLVSGEAILSKMYSVTQLISSWPWKSSCLHGFWSDYMSSNFLGGEEGETYSWEFAWWGGVTYFY